MTLPSILYLFLTHLGVGLVFILLLVSRQAGVKFFRFNAGLAALLIGGGLVFRPADSGGGPGLWATVGLAVALAALALYWATIGRVRFPLRSLLLPVATAAGAATLAVQAMIIPAHAAIPAAWGVPLIAVSFLTSAALLGTTCGAMILGHWYLVIPSMDVSYLQTLTGFHIGSLVVRAVVVSAAMLMTILFWQPGLGPSFERYIFSLDGIFFWQRVLFGIGGPAVLSYLTWETAKIQSTQSATGILYVDFFAVVVGEVLAKYILLSTFVPI